jgi:uncharacterized protein YndB with AHSA1/START domain
MQPKGCINIFGVFKSKLSSFKPSLVGKAKMQDFIQREIIMNASKERIYAAIATPELLVKWFPETIKGEYKVGERPIFGFGAHGENQVYIVAASPHEYFAYRWVPGANHFLGDVLKVPNTLVEFRIAEQPNGRCKVTLKESGFNSLPSELMEAAFKQNSGGWEFMLGRLVSYFESL